MSDPIRQRQGVPGGGLGLSIFMLLLALGGVALAFPANSVRSRNIVDGQVKNRDLAPGAVARAELARGAVKRTKLAAGAVGPAELADGAVTAEAVGDGKLTGADLLDFSLGSAALAPGGVTAPAIATNSIGSGQVADGSLTGADFQDGSIGSGEVATNAVGPQTVAGHSLTGADIAEATLDLPIARSLARDDYSVGPRLHRLQADRCRLPGWRIDQPGRDRRRRRGGRGSTDAPPRWRAAFRWTPITGAPPHTSPARPRRHGSCGPM